MKVLDKAMWVCGILIAVQSFAGEGHRHGGGACGKYWAQCKSGEDKKACVQAAAEADKNQACLDHLNHEKNHHHGDAPAAAPGVDATTK